MSKLINLCLITGALVIVPGVARAQIEAEPEAGSTDSPETEDRGPVEADSAVTPLDSPDREGLKAGDDESIYIVQRRAYSKKGEFEVSPLVFTALNPKFVGYGGVGLSLAWHMRENLGFELMTSLWTYPFYSDLVFEVYEYEQLTPEEVDLKRIRGGFAIPPSFGALSVQFSALYGKLEFYGILLDYDFYATAGVGWVRTVEPCLPERGDCGEEVDVGRGLQDPENGRDRNKISGNLGGGARFYFLDFLGLRLEVRDIVYADRKVETTQSGAVGQASTDIRNNVMLFVAVSFLL